MRKLTEDENVTLSKEFSLRNPPKAGDGPHCLSPALYHGIMPLIMNYFRTGDDDEGH